MYLWRCRSWLCKMYYFIFYNNAIRTQPKTKRVCNDMYDNSYISFERKLYSKYNDLFLKFNDGESSFYINKERLCNVQQKGARMEFYFSDGGFIEIDNAKEGTIDV